MAYMDPLDVGADVVVTHRQPWSGPYGLIDDGVYFPINHSVFRDLVGRVLTHLDMLALPDRARRAARTLIVQDLWRWWGEAAENSVTSAAGCIAPVVVRTAGEHFLLGDNGEPNSNRWGWPSEDAYLRSQPRDEAVAAPVTIRTAYEGATAS